MGWFGVAPTKDESVVASDSDICVGCRHPPPTLPQVRVALPHELYVVGSVSQVLSS